MASWGAFSLNRNGVPAARRTGRVDGRQKLASFGPGVQDRCSYHPWSVTAMKPSKGREPITVARQSAAAATSIPWADTDSDPQRRWRRGPPSSPRRTSARSMA